MKFTFLLPILFLLTVCAQCEELAMDRDQPLIVHNQSTQPIRVLLNDSKDYNALYPDTSISQFKERLTPEILPEEKAAVSGSGEASWDNVWEGTVPNDTLSMFFFHSDTIDAYHWDTIRKEYKVLLRYDLSLQDLKKRNFVIEYPYDTARGELKTWP